MMNSELLNKLSMLLSRIPGVGVKNAKKAAFAITNWNQEDVLTLISLLSRVVTDIKCCDICGSKVQGECEFCLDVSRENNTILVAATEYEVSNIESSKCFGGLYHVLGGVLSPSNGYFGHDLRTHSLNLRIENLGDVSEIILAFEATIDGDATSLFVKTEVESFCEKRNIRKPNFSKIAFGIPIGSKVCSVDICTIAEAINNRRTF